MSLRTPFAIVDSAEDRFVTMETAMFAADLEMKYPPTEYRIVDMTGKEDVPFLEDTTASDLTVNLAGEWEWKLLPAEIALRAQENKTTMLRMEQLTLYLRKDQAILLGPDFDYLAPVIQARIDLIEAELSGAMP